MRRMCAKSARMVSVFLAIVILCTVTALAADVKVGTVNADTLNLRDSASTTAKVLEQADTGDKVVVLEKTGDWYKVIYNQTHGFMHTDFIVVSASEDFAIGLGRINATAVNFRKGPSLDAGVISKLDKNKQVEVVGIEDGWYKVDVDGKIGYVHPDYVTIARQTAPNGSAAGDASQKEALDTPDDKDGLRAEIVAYAKTFLGCKYKYGSMNGKTFDCSGFTTYVYKNFGYTLNRSAAGQLSNGVKVSSRDKLKPGDLVLFRDPSINKAAASHTGIYVGDGQFIHASSRGGGVKYNSLNDTYYNKYYIGGRRIVT